MTGRRIKLQPPTLLDRLVGYVSPAAGLARARGRAVLTAATSGGYVGGRKDRRATQEWGATDASANADVLPDLEVLRGRARDLERNDPLAASAISTRVNSVVGTGHVVSPAVDAAFLGLSDDAKEAWEDEAKRVWAGWASSRDCDLTRGQTFAELEDLAFRGVCASGDVFVAFRDRPRPGRALSTCLQVIEADLVSNPDRRADARALAGGIEVDRDGAPLAYYVADRHQWDVGFGGTVKWTRVPAFRSDGSRAVLHLLPRRRPGQLRGAPMLAPVIEALKQRSRYTDAELMAAVVNACFAIAMKSDDGALSDGLPSGGTTTDAKQIKITEAGQIFDLMPNESIQSFTPARPAAGFDPFISALAREIGAGIDMPAELLTKSFQASYSASRAALEMAWQFFRTARAWHVAGFCAPVYEEVISEAVARGLLRAPGFFAAPAIRRAWLGAQWVGPSRVSIDPVKDATADEMMVAMGVKTVAEVTAERTGGDWEVKHRQRVREQRVRVKDGLEAPLAAAPGAAQAAPAEPDDDDAGSDDDSENEAA